MKRETAVHARSLLYDIDNLICIIDRLREERDAEDTGLDPKTPGAKHHIIESISREWPRVGEKTVAFFIEAWDSTIRSLEEELRSLKQELDEL